MRPGKEDTSNAINLIQFASDLKKNLYRYAKREGFIRWRPLVPMNEFTECMVNYIGILNSRGHEFGDYLEFGVSRGTSIVGAFNALKRMNQNEARLVGFDSFEGMPRTAGSEGWAPGAYASSIGATRRYIEKGAVLDT